MNINVSLEKIKENLKPFFWFVLTLGVFIGFGYAIPYSLFIMPSRTRTIIGVIFQFMAGLIFVADQILGKMPEAELLKIQQRITSAKNQPKVALLVLLVIFPFGILAWLWISAPKEMTLSVILGVFFWLLIGYVVYLFCLQKLTNLFIKWKPDRDTALYYSNAIMFVCSIPLAYISLYLARLHPSSVILQVLIALFILAVSFCAPALLLSGSYYLVLGGIALIRLINVRWKKRYFFWILILLLWTWASALLLMNAFSSS